MSHPIRIANAPCSWGVLELAVAGKSPEYPQVLDEMASAGYEGTELGDWGFMPTDPERLREELAQRKLEMLAAFVPVALRDASTHEDGRMRALATARLLAAVAKSPFIVLADDNGADETRTKHAGRITPEQGLGDDAWRTFARGADDIARAVLDETGVRTVFHPHCAGFVETPGEIERFLGATDPKLVGLCLDTGHTTFGGGDALALTKKANGRIWHVHFKDCHAGIAKAAREAGADYFEAVRLGVFCELGQGEVDFRGVLDELRAMEYRGWIVVEQDVLPGMGTPLDSAKRSREFLRDLGL